MLTVGDFYKNDKFGENSVINKRTFLAVFGSDLCTATFYPLQKTRWGGKISFIASSFVSRKTSHIDSNLLCSFLADGEVLLDEVAFSCLD